MSTTRVKGVQGLARALRGNAVRVRKVVLAAALETCKEGVGIAGHNLGSWSSRSDALHGIWQGLNAEPTSTGAILHASHPASGFYEVGTRPHRIPLTPLADWARGWGATEPFAVAKAFQMRVEQYGTEPLWFMKQAIPPMQEIFHAYLGAHLAKDGGGDG